ncbi:hypothetical protein [Candidatus Nitrospira neomarina]|uniref:Uncharacterized protein n=1 Tax=Candidatus Nitrospira neomarina TaxID=3020899 RepID=A0AA96GUE9_9BACT|nr:hypothetical protein [Candidatus Nitrospira neomarina]WNM63776.1 hypothetical protein PQG83_08480 [Candidatus Nitrospira neomarina]
MEAKVGKTMDAPSGLIGLLGREAGRRATSRGSNKPVQDKSVRSWGRPAGVAETRGVYPEQCRGAQTMRAFPPGSAALLGHTTRHGKPAETLRPLISEDQLAESTLSYVERLRQGSPADKSIRA